MNKQIQDNELFFAKVKPNAIIPSKRKEDAGYDVYTCETETIVIPQCSTRMIDTGIGIGCSPKWFPKFFDKGGMGSNGIIVGAGVGDSGYRNSYFIPLINTNQDKWLIITTQTEDEIKECNFFDVIEKTFVKIKVIEADPYVHVPKGLCIIKPINKAIAQFVMLPVPELETKETSWDELKEYVSERGLGNRGSSGK